MRRIRLLIQNDESDAEYQQYRLDTPCRVGEGGDRSTWKIITLDQAPRDKSMRVEVWSGSGWDPVIDFSEFGELQGTFRVEGKNIPYSFLEREALSRLLQEILNSPEALEKMATLGVEVHGISLWF